MQSIEIYVFYFDLIGVVDAYFAAPARALEKVAGFQRVARRKFEFGNSNSYVVTLADNVCCRVSSDEAGTPSLLLEYAGTVMSEAKKAGFAQYFGAITKGVHSFEPEDRTLVGKDSLADLTEQHIDITSDPYLRAIFAEKWSKQLASAHQLPAPPNSVWVSSEVMDRSEIEAYAIFGSSTFSVFSPAFDLSAIATKSGQWPFKRSLFNAILAK
jgi:hypothetical protein